MNQFSYVYTFFQSNLLEIPVYIMALTYWMDSRTGSLDIAKKITLINVITHPIVFFVIMAIPSTYLQGILMAETFAIIAESLLLIWVFRVSVKKSFASAFVANLFSWQVAPLLTYAIFY